MGFREAWSQRPNRGLMIQVGFMTAFCVFGVIDVGLPRHAYWQSGLAVGVVAVFWVFVTMGVRRDWFIRK